ncbi:MAG: hypothetical protein QNJ97_17835 [Myxococcota bacterium]|nr:hypothetical protein [Myxococcota bacterium]
MASNAWNPGDTFVNVDVKTGQGTVSAASRTRSNSAFIRELWEDEIIASYKSNLVMPQLVVVMDHNRKKGDTIHVPNPVRGSASEKLTESSVTLIAAQEEKKQYLIDQHWEYSRLIEDVVDVQADDSLRRFYTDDAGFALAREVDTKIHDEGQFLNAATLGSVSDATDPAASALDGAAIGSGLTQWNAATSGNGAALTDAGIRAFTQSLDDNDSPVAGRYMVIPPVAKNTLLGETRYTQEAFIGERGAENSIRNGRVGDVYGTEVFVSTNCGSVASADSTPYRVVLFFQEEAMLLIEQLRPRVQDQYKQEFLSTLMTADTLFGTGLLRPEGGLAIVVPA